MGNLACCTKDNTSKTSFIVESDTQIIKKNHCKVNAGMNLTDGMALDA
jgi:hypothetical protein